MDDVETIELTPEQSALIAEAVSDSLAYLDPDYTFTNSELRQAMYRAAKVILLVTGQEVQEMVRGVRH